ncbi:hypothetical protein RI367_004597 [Sorochytrium milnesiophthora]
MQSDIAAGIAAKYHQLLLPELELPSLDQATVQQAIDGLAQLQRHIADTLDSRLLDPATRATLQRVSNDIMAHSAVYERFAKHGSALNLDAILSEEWTVEDEADVQSSSEVHTAGIETGSVVSQSSSSVAPTAARTQKQHNRRTSMPSHLLLDVTPRSSDRRSTTLPPYTGPVLSPSIDAFRESLSQAIDPYDPLTWTPLQRISEHVYDGNTHKRYGVPTVLRVERYIAIGMSSGCVLLYDSSQTFRYALGSNSLERDHGSVTAIDINKKLSHMLVGYATGHIAVFELSRYTLVKSIVPLLNAAQLRSTISHGSSSTMRHGHLAGARVIHVAFVGGSKSHFVTADDKGLAFYHHMTQVLMIYRTETFRLFGSYKNKLNTSDLTTIFALNVFPHSNVEHPTNSMNLVALTTPFKMVIASVKGSIKTLFRLTRSQTPAPYLGTKAIGSGCLALYPATDFCDPLVAVSWSSWLGIYILRCNRSGTKLDVQLIGHFTCEWSIVSVHFLTSEIVVVHNAEDQFQMLDLNKVAVVETSSVHGRSILAQDYFSKPLKRLGAEVADMSFVSSIQATAERLFVLTSTNVFCSALSPWSQRIRAMASAHDPLRALQTLQALYDYQETGMVLADLPAAAEDRETAVRSLIIETLQNSISQLSPPPGAVMLTGEDGHPILDADVRWDDAQRLIRAIIECTLLVKATYLLFGLMHDQVRRSRLYPLLYEALDEFIAQDALTQIPADFVQALVQYFVDKTEFARVEQLVLHLDANGLHSDFLVRVCKEHKLWKPLFHVHACGFGDYLRAPNSALQQLAVGAKDAELALTLFEYLHSVATRTGWFGERVSDPDLAFKSVTSFIMDDDNLVQLLHLDSSRTVKCLEGLLEDRLMQEGFSLAVTVGGGKQRPLSPVRSSDTRVSHQLVMDHLLTLTDTNAHAALPPHTHLLLLCLVAQSAKRYRDRIVVPSHKLHDIFLMLTSDRFTGSELQAQREHAVIDLLDLLNLGGPQEVEILQLCEERGLWRVCELIYRKQHSYDKLLRCYLADPSRRVQAFDVVRRTLDTPYLDAAQVTAFKASVMEYVSDLATVDVKELALVVCERMPDAFSSVARVLHGIDGELEFLNTGLMLLCQQQDDAAPDVPEDAPTHRPPPLPAVTVDQSIIERYIALLISSNPASLPARLQRLTRLVPLGANNEILAQVKTAHHVEATAWLLEQRGCFVEALEQFTREMTAAVDSLLQEQASPVTVATGLKRYARMNQSAINLCRQHSRTLTAADRHTLWLALVDCALLPIQRQHQAEQQRADTQTDEQRRQQKFIKNELKRVLSLTLQSMSGSVALPTLLRRIIEAQAHAQLSSYRFVLQELLDAYHYEDTMLSTTLRLCQQDTRNAFARAVRDRRHAFATVTDHCQVCYERLQSATAAGVGGRGFVAAPFAILKCGHSLHMHCAENEQLVQQHAEGRQPGGNVICPVCDTRYHAKLRRARLAGKRRSKTDSPGVPQLLLGDGNADPDGDAGAPSPKGKGKAQIDDQRTTESLYMRFRDLLRNPDLEDDDDESMAQAMSRLLAFPDALTLAPPPRQPAAEGPLSGVVRVPGLLPLNSSVSRVLE